MKPGKYYFSEDFISWFRPMMEAREAINQRKAAGMNEAGPPAASPANGEPPTPKQLGYLKQLGATTVPTTKREASDMISDLLKNKDKE